MTVPSTAYNSIRHSIISLPIYLKKYNVLPVKFFQYLKYLSNVYLLEIHQLNPIRSYKPRIIRDNVFYYN